MIDLVRREWRQYMVWLVLVVTWQLPFVRRASDATAIALSMMMTVLVGPIFAERLLRREIFLLPASPRQLWLAMWCLAVAVAVTWTGLAKLTAWRGVEFAVVSLLCDLAYAGACMALWTLLDIRPRGSLWIRRTAIRGQMLLWLMLTVGSPVWPFVMRPFLPTTLEDLAGGKGIGLAVALALTAWGYLHTPSPEAPRQLVRTRVETGGRRPPPVQRRDGPLAVARPSMTTAKLSGIAYHLVRDAAVSVTYAALAIGGLFVVALVLQPTAGLRPAFDRVLESVAPRDAAPALGLLLLLLISTLPAGLNWQRAVRMMRVLPLAPAHLVALLLAVPLWRWLAFWVAGFILTALAGRAAAPFPPDGLLALTGICALIQATSLRWSGARPGVFIGVVIVGLMIVSAVLSVGGQIAAGAAGLGVSLAMSAGLLTLVVAALLNYHTLTRRAATYRRPVTAEMTPI